MSYIPNYKTMQSKSRSKHNGRSKSNSLNPSHSYQNYRRKSLKPHHLAIEGCAEYRKFLPERPNPSLRPHESRRLVDKNEELRNKYLNTCISQEETAQYSSRSSQNPINPVTDLTSYPNPIKNCLQQSSEKAKVTDERYEGSSNGEVAYLSKDQDSYTDLQDTESVTKSNEMPLRMFCNSQAQPTDKSRTTFCNNIVNYENVVHATFNKKGFMNPPTMQNSMNPSHNTSIETVVNKESSKVEK